MADNVAKAENEVVDICRDLIRIDTTNPGDHSGPGERAAAEYVAGLLSEVGAEPQIYESHPKRSSVVARIPGEDPSRDALLIHGHLDVVPASASDWSRDPFSGEIADGCVWGRGAVDMKDMDAMMLAAVRQRLREGRKPARDVVLAFPADEEAGGTWGADYLIKNHRDLFEGCTKAIGEVGGFSVSVGDQRMYAVQIAEKGIAWMRLLASGTAGHGSMIHSDNAVTELAEAIARIGRHEWPTEIPPSTRAFLEAVGEALGTGFDPENPQAVISKLGGMAKLVSATIQDTSNPTRLGGGYKVNVIPQTATAEVDGRFLPGHDDSYLEQIDRLLGDSVSREFIFHGPSVETAPDGSLYEAMSSSLLAEDPDGKVVPYCLSAGTDAKSFSELGMRCFGFSPLRLPAEMDFAGMFHGIDERVPVDGLQFGVRVLDRLLDNC
ncbi:MAG: M20/M25/M40 family metallo-hydrolase [Streptosporangiales bacterium]|nr:M20/M25/M40 family metallo-hydrolase [Streptosporangiales bacterium]